MNNESSLKLSLEQVKEFAESVGYVVLDNEYINAHTKMHFKCKECGLDRYTSFSNLKGKRNCKCKNKSIPPTLIEKLEKLNLSMTDKLEDINSKDKLNLIDKDGYLYSLSTQNLTTLVRRNGTPAKFFNKNPYTYENINNYFKINNIDMVLIEHNPKNSSTPMLFRCMKHNKNIVRSWNSVLNGAIGCEICIGIKRHTYEDIVKYVESKGNKFLSEEYNGVHKDYKFKCSCGNEYIRRMDVFMYQDATLCLECAGINIYTYETVFEELKNNKIELISTEYKNISEKIKIKYSCGFETERTLLNIRISNYECPHCNKKGYKRNTETFYKEIYALVGDEYKFEGEYTICDAKMDVTHVVCGYRYVTSPHKFINGGHRCPACNTSKAELEINKYLSENNYDYKKEYTFEGLVGLKGMPLRFDFAIKIKDILLLVEYDGEFHYKPIEGEEKLKIQQEHDRRKDMYCKEKCIPLLRIPYWEKNNMIDILEKEINKIKEEGKWLKGHTADILPKKEKIKLIQII